MEGLFALLVSIAIPAIGVIAARVERRRRQRVVGEAAARLSLTPVPAGFLSGGEEAFRGEVRGCRVTGEGFMRSKQYGFRVVAEGRFEDGAGIPPTLRLSPDSLSLSLLQGTDTIIGDTAFDARVRVSGDDGEALAVLDREARAAVLAALDADEGLRVDERGVVVEVAPLSDAAEVVGAVDRATRLARKLACAPAEIPRRLVQSAVHDPNPGVRLRAFEALQRRGSGAGFTESTALHLLRDRHPEVRFRAAVSLGAEGLATLEALVTDASPPAGAGAQGHVWWELNLPGGNKGDVPEEILDTARAHEARRGRALGWLAEIVPPERVRELALASLGSVGPLRVAALEALETAGDASCEREVAAVLDSEEKGERVAAVRALGACGTAAAVPQLRALALRSGAMDFALRRAVDEAVARIKSRIPGAAAGQVALAGEPAEPGRVSLAAGAGPGQVSLAAGGEPAPEEGRPGGKPRGDEVASGAR